MTNYCYVTNTSTNTVSVISTVSESIVATVNVGTSPISVAVSHDGNFIYTINNADNTISVIDASINSVSQTIPIHPKSVSCDISPDGTRLYIAEGLNNALSCLTLSSGVITYMGGAYNPVDVRFAGSGNFAVVSNYAGLGPGHDKSGIGIYNALANTYNRSLFLDPIERGDSPRWTRVSKDETVCYVVNPITGILFVELSSGVILATLAVTPEPSSSLSYNGLCITKDGSKLFCSALDSDIATGKTLSNKILVIDTASMSITNQIDYTGIFYSAEITPDGKKLYLANLINNSIDIFDLTTNAITKSIAVPGASYSLNFARSNTYIISGCMDATATNYNPLATINDGSCIYLPGGGSDTGGGGATQPLPISGNGWQSAGAAPVNNWKVAASSPCGWNTSPHPPCGWEKTKKC